MRTGSLRGAPLAGLVSPYHAVHVGPCRVVRVASAWRKKLQTRKCGSAYRNCATCSQECCGADGTALNTCCIGPSGEDDINSEPCAATIASADQPCLHSIYNCSTKAVALGLLTLFCGLHLSGLKLSSRIQQFTSSITAVTFLLLAGACLVHAAPQALSLIHIFE